jgi:DNA-binding CsgD family transcriptional regulator/predicted Ser/Thr protein kinase
MMAVKGEIAGRARLRGMLRLVGRGMDSGSIEWLLRALARTETIAELPVAGTLLGRYRLIEPIGRGGFGIVFKAVDTQLEREVALKVLHSSGRDDKAEQRLLREAQAMARLKHENLLTVYDVGTFAAGQLFVAMELVDGMSLRAWLEAEPRATGEILARFLQAAAGLAAAHRAGVVHRDFKPDNVLVGRDGTVRVADFGLASVGGGERDAHIGGTPRYMAPEQARGDAANPKMDQYSFALALWEALTGRHPRLEGDAAPAGRALPKRLRAPLERALQLDPEQRFPSLEPLIAALARPRVRRAGAAIADVIDVIDASYRTDGDDRSWLEGVARATHAAIGSDKGVFAYFYQVTEAGGLVPGAVLALLGAAPWSESIAGTFDVARRVLGADGVRQTFGRLQFETASQAGSPETRAKSLAGTQQRFAEAGWRDVLNLSAFDPTGMGVGLGLPLTRETKLAKTMQTTWQRVAAHVAAGYRLRRRLAVAESQRPEAADAILTAAGKIAHLAPAAQARATRDELAHAAVAIRRARGPLRQVHPDAAVAGWQALVDARWTLVDHRDRDGKRFLLARRNDVATPGPARLDARERQVLAHAQLGHDNTLVAYELGLSERALEALLQRARAKLDSDGE